MRGLREWLHRLWGALRRNATDRDLEGELRFHLQMAEDVNHHRNLTDFSTLVEALGSGTGFRGS